MKSTIKYISLLLIIGFTLSLAVSVNASVFDWFNSLFNQDLILGAPELTYNKDLYPISNLIYKLGSSTREWLSISVKNASTTITSATTLCLSGDACRTTWPTGGGTTITQLGQIEDVSTSTLSFGHLLMWDGSAWQDTATSALGLGGSSGTVSSVDMSVPTGLTISGNPITTTGTLALTLTSGYNIPLNSSTQFLEMSLSIHALSIGRKPTWASFSFGLARSIVSCATLKSPHKITGFLCPSRLAVACPLRRIEVSRREADNLFINSRK